MLAVKSVHLSIPRALSLERLTTLILCGFILAYGIVALARVAYPFDLDFLEDDNLIEAWRFSQGWPVFVAPNADFVPHAYAPLYMLLSADLFKLSGVGFSPMRLLSLAATVATAILLGWAGYAISRRSAVALIGPGLFLAGYALTGAQYELARVDSLMLALVIGGTLLGVMGAHSRRAVALSALCLALAFFSKQTGLIFGVGMAGYLFATRRRHTGTFLLLLALMIGIPLIVMDSLTGGWSTRYLLEVPGSDPLAIGRVISYVRHDLLQSLGPLCAITLASIVLGRGGPPLEHPIARAWPWFALVALAASGWMRARLGGNLNSLIPAYTFLCLMPAILLDSLAAARPALGVTGRRLVYLAVIGQCVIGVYNPASEIPGAAMQESGWRLIQRIAQMPGPVLVAEHPYYALLAGKAPGVSLTALWHARGRGASPLPDDLAQRIRQQSYAAIITDEGTYPEVEADLDALIAASYPVRAPLGAQDAPPTLSGVIVQPAWVYTPGE
ncbi:MAG: glycosyltransferase family 39 protein [Chloroflexi bacterium]|nr:glycosyltransferase family 39 protein [Chloroflexota bacterium]MBI3733975.1 glycosyltransferase family 39 protein [Chloroflexota bacterium]